MATIFMEYGKGNLSRLPRHENPGLEIIYLQEGNLIWECEGKPESVPPHSLYFTLPGQKHGSVSEFEPGHYWYFVVIRADFKGSHVRFPVELGFDSATERTIGRLLTEARSHVRPASALARLLLPGLINELEHPSLLHEQRLLRMTSQLILELAVLADNSGSPSNAVVIARFAKLLDEIQKSCMEPWTLNEMSSRVGLGPTRFIALFRQQTGDSPVHYLQRLRVEQARKLLRTTNSSVTDIALACGFSSSQHLAHVFKQFTGTTASGYRQHGPPELILPRSVEKSKA